MSIADGKEFRKAQLHSTLVMEILLVHICTHKYTFIHICALKYIFGHAFCV